MAAVKTAIRKTDVDEVDEVIAELRRLAQRADSPLVRACLDATVEDLVHLTSSGDDDDDDLLDDDDDE